MGTLPAVPWKVALSFFYFIEAPKNTKTAYKSIPTELVILKTFVVGISLEQVLIC